MWNLYIQVQNTNSLFPESLEHIQKQQAGTTCHTSLVYSHVILFDFNWFRHFIRSYEGSIGQRLEPCSSLSMGPCNFLPIWCQAGVTPMDSCEAELIAKLNSGRYCPIFHDCHRHMLKSFALGFESLTQSCLFEDDKQQSCSESHSILCTPFWSVTMVNNFGSRQCCHLSKAQTTLRHSFSVVE